MALSAVTISAAGTREKACQRSDADGLDLLATPSGGQGSESGMAIFGELARRASIARSRHRIGGKAEAQVRVVEKTHPRAQAAPAQPRQSPDLLCQQSRRPLRALLPPVTGRPGQDQCRTRTVQRRRCRKHEVASRLACRRRPCARDPECSAGNRTCGSIGVVRAILVVFICPIGYRPAVQRPTRRRATMIDQTMPTRGASRGGAFFHP
jgi:hypothetical protein